MGQEPRRKRKWDQPDESLISASISMPGILPVTNVGSVAGNLPINPLIANVIHTPIMQQQAAAVIRKLTQPKTQEELVIAREIVINDAEPTMRYKLTRRQTQEEIQKCTGAVVITRGKYRPPNAMPDGDKPLYLHISAGAHLKETAEKIITVDRAAAVVEDLMKPTSKAFSASIYLGFDADPSLSLPTRIRGPNDQYVNHIMNETGVAVSLRGRGSGNAESAKLEEGEQPLHLFLSSNNAKALEDAKLLAENLLDTVRRECGITRVAPTKVYAAVPPPQNLSVGVQISGVEANSTPSSGAPLASVVGNSQTVAASSVATPGVSTAFTYGSVAQPNGMCHSQPALGNVTGYSGYGGIYPQATPLQQVALALRQTCSFSSTISPATSVASTVAKTSDSASSAKNKQPPQKRKFQELPATSKGTVASHQVLEDLGKPGNLSAMPPPKRLAGMSSNGMPPPPPKNMPPPPPLPVIQAKPMPPVPKDHSTMGAPASRGMPPPPPKFNSTPSALKAGSSGTDDKSKRPKPETVPETLVKLMEYGEGDDDDPDETAQDSSSLRPSTAPKPFWAV